MLTPNNTMPLTITDDQGVERRLHAIDFNPDEERQPFSRLTAYIYATDIKDAERQAVHMRYPNPPFPTVTALG